MIGPQEDLQFKQGNGAFCSEAKTPPHFFNQFSVANNMAIS
jgi:hypothetical protein